LQRLAPKARIILRTNTNRAQISAAEEGSAIAALPRVPADNRPHLVRLEAPRPPFILPVRLGVHISLRSMPRVRTLIDFIAALPARQSHAVLPVAEHHPAPAALRTLPRPQLCGDGQFGQGAGFRARFKTAKRVAARQELNITILP
jgi:hypothetical protein